MRGFHVRHAGPTPHEHYTLPGFAERLKTVGSALAAMCLAAGVALVGLTLGFLAAALVFVGLLAAAGAAALIRSRVRRL